MNINRELTSTSQPNKASCLLSEGNALSPPSSSSSRIDFGRRDLDLDREQHHGLSFHKGGGKLVGKSPPALSKAGQQSTYGKAAHEPNATFFRSDDNECFSLSRRHQTKTNKSAVSAGRALLGRTPTGSSSSSTATTDKSTPMHRIARSNSTRSILREGRYSSSCLSLTSLVKSDDDKDRRRETLQRGSSQRSVVFAAVISQSEQDAGDKYEDDGELDLDDILQGKGEISNSDLSGGENDAVGQSAEKGLANSDWSGWENESGELDMLEGHGQDDDDDEINDDEDLVAQLRNLSTFSSTFDGEKSMVGNLNMSELSLDELSLEGVMSPEVST